MDMFLTIYEEVHGTKQYVHDVKFILSRDIRFRSKRVITNKVFVMVRFDDNEVDRQYKELYQLFESTVDLIGEQNDAFVYRLKLPTDVEELRRIRELVIEIKQSRWTFWRRWFERYYVKYHVNNGELARAQLIVERGLFSISIEQEELLYFSDVNMHKSLKERLLGYGDVTLLGNETTTKTLVLHNLLNVDRVSYQLNDLIQNLKKGIQRIEYIHTTGE